jgi:hypothetical protein
MAQTDSKIKGVTMFIKMVRILPDSVQTVVNVNTDQVIWAQAGSDNTTITVMPTAGPELIVKNDASAQKLMSLT